MEWYSTLEPFVYNVTELPEQEIEEEEIGVDIVSILWGIGGVVFCCGVFKLCHWLWNLK